MISMDLEMLGLDSRLTGCRVRDLVFLCAVARCYGVQTSCIFSQSYGEFLRDFLCHRNFFFFFFF